MKPVNEAICCLAALFAASAAATPAVSGVTLTQGEDNREVTITYTLSGEEAVITLDVQTNNVSIGGGAVWNASGDVWKKISTGSRTITWRPDLSWPGNDAESVTAVVTAWPLTNTPDYMVVDLAIPADGDNITYYPGAEYLPKASYAQEGAAVTNNPAYKTTKLLMRKILAKDVTWTMGSPTDEPMRNERAAGCEAPHSVTLEHNYYIGVFELTQKQWAIVGGPSTTPSFLGDMRPMGKCTWDDTRNAYGDSDPASGTFLALLRTCTGISDFDLPSEAQWEFACRAGNGSPYWGDGSEMVGTSNDKSTSTDANLAKIAHYKGNADVQQTAVVGSYAPNSWGIYDMHGNVWEWCLDRYVTDITSNTTGAVMTSGSGGPVNRGGGYQAGSSSCRSAERFGSKNTADFRGFRVACRAGLE